MNFMDFNIIIELEINMQRHETFKIFTSNLLVGSICLVEKLSEKNSPTPCGWYGWEARWHSQS